MISELEETMHKNEEILNGNFHLYAVFQINISQWFTYNLRDCAIKLK